MKQQQPLSRTDRDELDRLMASVDEDFGRIHDESASKGEAREADAFLQQLARFHVPKEPTKKAVALETASQSSSNLGPPSVSQSLEKSSEGIKDSNSIRMENQLPGRFSVTLDKSASSLIAVTIKGFQSKEELACCVVDVSHQSIVVKLSATSQEGDRVIIHSSWTMDPKSVHAKSSAKKGSLVITVRCTPII